MGKGQQSFDFLNTRQTILALDQKAFANGFNAIVAVTLEEENQFGVKKLLYRFRILAAQKEAS